MADDAAVGLVSGVRRRGAAAVRDDTVMEADSPLVKTIKKLDYYPKTVDDFREKTTSGAIVSLIAVFLMASLVCYESIWFIQGETVNKMSVDLSGKEKLRISMDIVFHRLPCDDVTIDVMDTAGDNQIDVLSHVHKIELDSNGKVLDKTLERKTAQERMTEFEKQPPASKKKCRSCPDFVPADVKATGDGHEHCCNSCQDIKDLLALANQDESAAEQSDQCKEEKKRKNLILNEGGYGCQLEGYVEVNKVAGNFHFAPGHSYQHAGGHHIHEFKPNEAARFNVSHTINKLTFGQYEVPGRSNALDGTSRISEDGPGVFQYFIKVIPTTYQPSEGVEYRTHQYAVTQHQKPSSRESGFVLPGIFFIYDINPIMVTVTEKHTPLLQFLVRLCAIVGGIFTISGFIDAIIHNAFTSKRAGPMVL